jgi:ubiquinone/menaquinone biosynthesis C-methylase UbiE
MEPIQTTVGQEADMDTEPKDSNQVRVQQREEWTALVSGWDVPELGTEVWAPVERMLTLAQIRPGQRVLDLACGTGNAAIVERVGPDGYMLGLDITPAMIDVAQAWVRQHKLRTVEFRVIESESMLSVPAMSFDVATCSFGLMYMPDPIGALRAVYEALKLDGRIAVCTWASLEQVPWLGVAAQILRRHLDPSTLEKTGPGPCALPTQEVLAGLLSTAGFTDVETVRIEAQDNWWSTPAAYWDTITTDWLPVLVNSRPSEDALQTIRDDALKTLSTMFPNGSVQFTNTVLLAAGNKAG